MGLFSKKTLNELLAQRPDGLLGTQTSALFLPDPTWACEKDTGLPMMFRFSARLGDIPIAVRALCKKDKGIDPIGRKYYDEIVDVHTFLDILKKRGSYLDGLIPLFMELYGMKENLIDHCGTLEQLFADASYVKAMEVRDWAEGNHAGEGVLRQALLEVSDIEKLFPYINKEDDTRDMVTRKIDFIENQRRFLKDLLKKACRKYDKIKEREDPKKNDYYELQTDVRAVILWLAMHKVPWALKMYCDGSLMTYNTGEVFTHFPLGYFYSNIDTNYFHNMALRNKTYAYSIEKTNELLTEAEEEYKELKRAKQ